MRSVLARFCRLAAWVLPAMLGNALGSVAVAETHGSAPNRDHEFLRGMVVSCPRAGQIWGTQEMAESLGELRALGINWVAIHPYARVSRDGTVQFRPTHETAFLQRAVELARAAGVGLFWKPHLAYWGSFAWRGEIQFGDDEAAWERFFEGYRQFILDQARFAEMAGVELLAVGVEYEQTTRFDDRWRQIILEVRQVFSGRLTYSANWDSLARVPFWDAVDLIGVHGYYPLATDERASRQALWNAWEKPLAELAALSRVHGDKPVLFAEIGYPRSSRAAAEPWDPDTKDSAEIRAQRQDLIEVALQRITQAPFAAGMFWWKWIPGDDTWDRDFSMKDPEAREALSRHWKQLPAATPAAASAPRR